MNFQHSIPESAEILAWLTDALHVSNGKGRDLGIIRRLDNPSSTHWIIGRQPNELEELVVVKMHSSQALYEQEKNALTTLSDFSSPTEPYAVPKLLAFSDNFTCIALEWVDGESISAAIRSSVSRISSDAELKHGQKIANRVGVWLEHLKRRTADPATRLPGEEMKSRFIRLVQFIATSHPRLLPGASQIRLVDTFEQYVDTSEPEENCLVHNDFWFDHIWTRNDQIIVLDFGRAQMGPAGRDAIQFFCRLQDLTKFNPLISKPAGEELIKSFITGYGGLDLSNGTNRLWQLWTRVEQLAGLIESSVNKPRNMLSYTVRTRALARQLLEAAY